MPRDRKYFLLLASIICFIVIPPLLEGRQLIPVTFGTLVLVAAIGCLRFGRKRFIASRWFGVSALLSGWVAILSGSPILSIVDFSIRVGFLITVTVILIYQVAKSAEVTLSVVVGAIDGYLLLGIIGTSAFIFLERISPGSIIASDLQSTPSALMYYSFITLTTVGYGDFTPVSVPARTIAIGLAATGQLYIAILIALLVGKFAAGAAAK